MPPADRRQRRRTGARGSRSPRHLRGSGQPREALDLLFAALVQNPHALSIHQAIWRALGQLHHPAVAGRPLQRADPHAVFYLDPHVCMRCRYRSTELLWQCPHCHDWNTFVEERIAPAQDTTARSKSEVEQCDHASRLCDRDLTCFAS